jgi:hypothetical protein
MKETYANIQGLLKKNMTRRPPMEHICWPEVVAMLTGPQGGCTKDCCVLCEWDNRASLWPLRAETILDQKNVAHTWNCSQKKRKNIYLHFT